ncbi:MAG: flagellar export chaperone FliS [Agarilytica sp.]
MAVAQTNAAVVMQERSAELTSHQVISLLLDGALERVAQVKKAIAEKNDEDKVILFGKIKAIINGLRNSLNMREGGEIAVNLDSLYEYMVARIEGASTIEEYAVATEVGKLLTEVQDGWVQLEPAE